MNTGSSSPKQTHTRQRRMSCRRSRSLVSFASPAVVTDVITIPRCHPDDVPKLFYSSEEQAMFRWEANSQSSLDWSIDGLIEDSIKAAKYVGFLSETNGCGEGIAVPKVWLRRAIGASMAIAYCTSMWLAGVDAIPSLIDIESL